MKLGEVDLLGDVGLKAVDIVHTGGRAIKDHSWGRVKAELLISERIFIEGPIWR